MPTDWSVCQHTRQFYQPTHQTHAPKNQLFLQAPNLPRPKYLLQSSDPMPARSAANYSHEEVMSLLNLVREHVPVCAEEWDIISRHHNVECAATNRNSDSLRRKFKGVATSPIPTGDPNIPETVRIANECFQEIKKKSNVLAFAESGEVIDPSTEESVVPGVGLIENENIMNEVAAAPTSVATNEANAPVNENSSTPVVSPRLARVARKRNSPEEMSVNDFFRFTLMQREQDRKDREAREIVRERERREERERRDAEERMFRQMFMAVLMKGSSDKNVSPDDNCN